ncbi:Butirosin biosynthesis, BtrG-like protein [Baffinella frigidus]|nr:Butirosin biosynthesis, BtrG-like protein [Cryptophyta sp. CCMP2293]
MGVGAERRTGETLGGTLVSFSRESRTQRRRTMRPLVSPAAAFNVLQDLSLVFVYGTLKRGLFNSKHLKTSIHIGAARTASKLPLITDEYYVPYLLHLPGTGHRIDGELWAVDDSVLATLDKLEGVPHYYERHRQEVRQ